VIDPALRTALGERFEFEHSAAGVLARRREARAVLDTLGFALDSDGAAVSSDLGGRNALLSLRSGDEEFLLRRFTHGGLLRWLTGRRFLDPERPFVEALLSEQLTAAAILTPQVVAARAVRAGAGAWKLDLVTRRVAGGVDLAAELERTSERTRRARLLSAFGAWLRRLHDTGFLHADLHPKNVLVTGGETPARPFELWVLDLDRSVLRPELDARQRTANLARLVRYVARRRQRLGLRTHDLARALAAYEPLRDARRELWRAVSERTRSTLPLHRAGWWLEARARGAQPMGEGPASSVTRG
jgi:hypothetical protein